MYRPLLIMVVLLVLASCQDPSKKPKKSENETPSRKGKKSETEKTKNEKLVWKEDFDKNELNEENWIYEEHCNQAMEIQCSTKRRFQNVRIQNGHLVIEARAEKFKNRQFTSGRLRTLKVWKYGKFQIRARLPKGKDLCSKLWMWPVGQKYGSEGQSGSVTIVQNRGDDQSRITSFLRYGGKGENIIDAGEDMTFSGKDLSKEFHTFGMEWTPVKISFSLDGKVYAERDIDKNLWGGNGQNPYTKNGQPFDKLFALVVHLSVGGEYCGQGTVTPEQARNWEKPTLEIDWIKVHQKEKHMVDNCDEGYSRLWADEFEGKALNGSKWISEVQCTPVNQAIQCYTDNRTENVRVEGGHLVLQARPEEWSYEGNTKQFTSARFHSKEAWAYGKFKIRAKLPQGKHLWPALWMWPQDDKKYGSGGESGEIDLMEARGETTNSFCSTVHFGAPGKDMTHWSSGFKKFNFDLSKDFHLYELVWTQKSLIFKLDEKEFWKRDINKNLWNGKGSRNPYMKNGQPFDSPFYIVINIAVGGSFFGNGPYVTPEQARGWPKPTMEIDYVRVFKDCDYVLK